MTMMTQRQRNELGKRLREARIRVNASQGTVADWCGMPQERISRYETGFRAPSPKTLAKLCSALELPFDEMLRLTL